MKKIITILLTFLFVTSCGYTPIYSTKNYDFKLKNIVTTKNKRLDSKVQKQLQSFSNNDSEKIISIEVDTQKHINTLAKDSRGNPSRFEMVVSIELQTTYGQNQNKSSFFEERFNYNSNVNKFELNQYEKEIEDLLINKNINRIIVYLSGV